MGVTDHSDPGPPADGATGGEELSFEDLGAAFARVAAEQSDSEETSATDAPSSDFESVGEPPLETDREADPRGLQEGDEEEAEGHVSPEAILEGALFVGHPESHGFTAQRLASLMRDVTPDEVAEMIGRLNESYRENGQALRIVEDDRGYRMTTAPDLDSLRQQFLGKVRETRLSQLAVEVLALVAYQPGVTAKTVGDQRGRDCGSVLNQLVRRRLLEIRRQADGEGGKPTATYYPTERFLVLFGLEQLGDLPQVDPAAQTAF